MKMYIVYAVFFANVIVNGSEKQTYPQPNPDHEAHSQILHISDFLKKDFNSFLTSFFIHAKPSTQKPPSPLDMDEPSIEDFIPDAVDHQLTKEEILDLAEQDRLATVPNISARLHQLKFNDHELNTIGKKLSPLEFCSILYVRPHLSSHLFTHLKNSKFAEFKAQYGCDYATYINNKGK